MEADTFDAPSNQRTSSILELERKVSTSMRNSLQFQTRDDGSLRRMSINGDGEQEFRGGLGKRASSMISTSS
jgi:hypothetical protein